MYNLDMILKGKDAHKANTKKDEVNIMKVECKIQQVWNHENQEN